MVMLLAAAGDDSADAGDDDEYDGDGGGDDCDHRNEGVANAHGKQVQSIVCWHLFLFTEQAHMASLVPSII